MAIDFRVYLPTAEARKYEGMHVHRSWAPTEMYKIVGTIFEEYSVSTVRIDAFICRRPDGKEVKLPMALISPPVELKIAELEQKIRYYQQRIKDFDAI